MFRLTDKYKNDALPEKREVARSQINEKYKFISTRNVGMHEKDNEKASNIILAMQMPENHMKQPYYKNSPFFNKKLKIEKSINYDTQDFKILQ